MERITIRRTETLAERQDGSIVAYAEPVACGCCGKKCTTKVVHLSNGHRVGTECAWTIEFLTASERPVTEEVAKFYRANKKQIAYLAERGFILEVA